MKMKNIPKTIALAGTLILLSGCEKFLSVQPQTQSTQDVLFQSPQGFKDALTGLYIQLKDNQLYGRDMLYGTMEHLVSSWDVASGTVQEKIGDFLYGDAGVDRSFAAIYRELYSTIANTNAILGKIDEYRHVFKNPNLYRLVKGEALAIRAHLHLDVLRLYGPVPKGVPDPSVRLPYVTELSTQAHERFGFDAYMEKLLKDLADAEAFLKESDPILRYSIAELMAPGSGEFQPSDGFFAYRYLRFNYYAVKGLQARAHLWKGDPAEAFAAAKAVIEAADRNGNSMFRLGTIVDFTNENYILTPEHVVSLYDSRLLRTYTSVFEAGIFFKGSTSSNINTLLYGNTGTDIRETDLWQTISLGASTRYVPNKYKPLEVYRGLVQDYKRLPLIRLSELYLIAAETAPNGQDYWDKFLLSRNVPPPLLEFYPEDRQLQIVREYRREFYAEGQAFFAYKRINAPRSAIVFAPSGVVVNYVVPVPASETTANAN